MQGILMKPQMIAATVEGRKTNTRRADASLRGINKEPDKCECLGKTINGSFIFQLESKEGFTQKIVSPRCCVGETVYIKEAIHRFNQEWASYNLDYAPVMFLQSANRFHWRWQKDYLSPLHLPQDAARHFILIEAVRAERLQEITEEDCKAEGIEEWQGMFREYDKPNSNPGWTRDAILSYRTLWNSINPKYPWDSNPWVWAYEFRLEIKVKGR